jgi:hypothetical protein
MKEILANLLKENRPNLSASSIKTYSSYLHSILKHRVTEESEVIPYLNSHVEQILRDVKGKPLTTQKSILSAVYILTKNEEIHKEMISLINEYNSEDMKQEKTDSQKENWISFEQIQQKYDELLPFGMEQLQAKKITIG